MSVNLETFRWLRQDVEARYTSGSPRTAVSPREWLARRRAAVSLVADPGGITVRVPWGPGWAPVGDAAMHQDPWTGLGIDMAGVHATFLADSMVDRLGGSVDERTAFES